MKGTVVKQKLLEAGFSLVLHSLTASLRRALPACAFKKITQKKVQRQTPKTYCVKCSTNFGQIKKEKVKEKLRIAKLFFYMI